MVALMYAVTRRVFPLGSSGGGSRASWGSPAALFAAGELVLPDDGRDRVPARAPRSYRPSGRCCTRPASSTPPSCAQLRAIRDRARGALSRSAQAPQDLEALRSRSDLMDEVHDA